MDFVTNFLYASLLLKCITVIQFLIIFLFAVLIDISIDYSIRILL